HFHSLFRFETFAVPQTEIRESSSPPAREPGALERLHLLFAVLFYGATGQAIGIHLDVGVTGALNQQQLALGRYLLLKPRAGDSPVRRRPRHGKAIRLTDNFQRAAAVRLHADQSTAQHSL